MGQCCGSGRGEYDDVVGDSRAVFVTGGSSGIGFELCKQLASEHGLRVLLGARNKKRGEEAVKKIEAELPKGCEGSVEFVECDVDSFASIKRAQDTVREKLDGLELWALVNNAGVNWEHTPHDIMKTNFYAVKDVTETFLPLLQDQGSRIVTTGSGAGPMWMEKASADDRKTLADKKCTWDDIDEVVRSNMEDDMDRGHAYGLSKAAVAAYTMYVAREHSNILSSVVSPGFVATNMTKGMKGTISPEEGTRSLKKCLLDHLPGNGYYYGSDGLRSPLDKKRDPEKDPEYTGN
eukprot:GFYU01007409.1.p1 GENE.GFYU01007409.1~~GFYU01007409.1.p1  ORF type:complete len:292 (+),score=101.23 GFYU01007409.1:103-978(+)